MRSSRVITVVGCHAGGEVGNVVVGGVLPPPGRGAFAIEHDLTGTVYPGSPSSTYCSGR